LLAGDVFSVLLNCDGPLTTEGIAIRGRKHFLPDSSNRNDENYLKNKVSRATHFLVSERIVEQTGIGLWLVVPEARSLTRDQVVASVHQAIRRAARRNTSS
jgi:hypothetical protein